MTTIDVSNLTYVKFAQGIHALIKELGLPAPVLKQTETGFHQNEGYFFVRWGDDNQAALIVPKGKGRLGNLHSHIDLAGKDGYIPLPKKNGKVVCHFAPDLEKVKAILPLFVGAAKRATLSPTPKATPAPTVAAPPVVLSVARPDDDYGAKELASWVAEEEEVEALINGQA